MIDQKNTHSTTHSTTHSRSRFKRFLLQAVCGRFRRLPSHRTPSVPALWCLSIAWGNFGYSAGLRYLRQVCRIAARQNGEIMSAWERFRSFSCLRRGWLKSYTELVSEA